MSGDYTTKMSAVTMIVMTTAVIVLMVTTVTTEAQHRMRPYEPRYPAMPYDFRYGVRDQYTGNDFGHEETSNGDGVSGRYYVLLPDGRRQVVSYVADPYRGYVATITYENVGFNPKSPGNDYRRG